MKILVVSNEIIKSNLESLSINNEDLTFEVISSIEKPMDVISSVLEFTPSILIIDDDLVSPDTFDVLKSIKNINKEIATIFITSNSSIDLGRKITPLGIQFYAIKPIENIELVDSIKSIINLKKKTTY